MFERRICFVLIASCALFLPVRLNATNAVGLSQGKLSAEPSGGVSYQMPIIVSPGTAGMQPKLAFQYSSGGRNGALGVGWSISGVSAITRAPQTLAQDNTIHGIDLTFNDRYALDGQRLIAITGTNGYAGTEYRTEINSFTKVVSNSQSGQGPATFTAWTKSGLIYTFGGANGASFVPAGRTDGTILTWLLSRVQDQAGNYMTFQYTSEGNLLSISYTMNGSSSAYASVVCNYDSTRPDPAIGYVAGSPVVMNQRLSRVTSYYGAQGVRQYDIAYEVSPTTKKSRLISIQESSATGSYQPTVFTWDRNTNSATLAPSLAAGAQNDLTEWQQGDFDGDGLVDMARMRNGVITIYKIQSGTLVASGSFTTSQNFNSTDVWVQGDFSSDGELDLLRIHGANGGDANFTLFTNTGTNGSGTAFSASTSTPGGASFYPSRIYMAMDADGDGKLDIVCLNGVDPQSGSAQPLTIRVYHNNGNGTFTPQVWNYTSTDTAATTAPNSDSCAQKDRWLVADFNGDGLPDLAKIWENSGKNTVRIYLNQNGSYVAANRIFKSGTFYEANNNTQPVAYSWHTGDFNGDGLADLLRVPKTGNADGANTADVFLSAGCPSSNAPPTFTGPQAWISLIVGEQASVQTGDYNADGRSDFVVLRDHVKGSPSTVQSYPSGDNEPSGPPFPDDPTGLTVFLDDPVTAAIAASEQISVNPDPTHPLPFPIPVINYPGPSGAEAAWDTASGTTATTTTYELTRGVYLSNGGASVPSGQAGFYLQAQPGDDAAMEINSNSVPVFKRWFTADFNGDGKEDLFRRFTTTDSSSTKQIYFNIYRTNYGYQDLMRTVTDGVGVKTSVDYEPLTGVNGVSVFTKSTDAMSPAIDLIVPMPVVASITYDNGLGALGGAGSTYSVSYHYEGLKADPLRGMLGFESVEAIDNRLLDGQSANLRIHTKSWLIQGFPLTGMVERTITYLADANTTKSFTDPSGLLSLVTTSYNAGPTENSNPHIYFPYASNSHSYSSDLNGAFMSDTETIAQQMDAYGNTLTSVVKTKDLPSSNYFVKTTASNYDVSTSNWRIGQVRGSTVVSQAPNTPSITRTSGFMYDPTNGQVNGEEVEPSSSTDWVNTAYQFDAFGNTKFATVTGGDMSPAGTSRVTETDYDTRGRFLSKTINALGQSEIKDYDQRFGAVTSVTGPNGLTDTAQYDDFGRKKLSTRADGTNTVTSYEWVASNSNATNAPANSVYLVRVTPDDGPQSITYFDRLGREMSSQTLDVKNRWILADTTYDYRGRKKTVSKPYFAGSSPIVATSFFDPLDRVWQVQEILVDENGTHVPAITTTFYNGLTVTVANPNHYETTTTKDGAGHVKQVQDALNGTITYTYDATGNLKTTTDSAGNITSIGYDVRGRKRTVNDPDLGSWSYSYYSTGELKTQTDAKTQMVTFHYDKLGRITGRDEPSNDTTTWVYDNAPGKGIGKLASVQFTPHSGSTLAPYSNSISYDGLGRPSSQSTIIHGTTYSTSTGYDQFSRPQTLTYPTGFQVKNVYGTNGYLTNVQNSTGSTNYWTQRENDAEGHITEEQYGNGIISDRVYIPENGLIQQIRSYVGSSTNPTVQNLEYHFDVLGNLKQRTDNNQTIGGTVLSESFNYDGLNRVINSTVTGQAQQNYTYDTIGSTTASLGNIKHKDGIGDYTYDPAHPHAVRTAGNSSVATYDPNGNMLSGFNRSITWTWFNQPQLITGNGASAYFEYDADHNRVWQHASVGGAVVDTTYVGGFFERVDDSNSPTIDYKHYISTPAGRVAFYTKYYNKTTFTSTANIKYLMRDHLGSVDVITSGNGSILERDSFDAWGSRRKTDWQGPVDSSFKSIVTRGFTDHEELDTLGLVHMNGRIYDPGIGRFLSADPFVQAPMVTQNFNRYSYVLNNPLSFSDPSGFNFLGDIGQWLTNALGSTGAQIVIAAVTVVAIILQQHYLVPLLTPFLGATEASVVVAVGAGFSAGFMSTALSGASLGQAFQIGLISGVAAGLTAGVIGPVLEGIKTPGVLGFLERVAAHGITGGVLNGVSSKLENGSFRDGFLAGAAAEGASVGINLVPGDSQIAVAERTVLSAAVGGTAAELGGGKFANGAVTAAFLRLYNEEAERSFNMRRSEAIARYGAYKNGVWAGESRWIIDYHVPDDIVNDPSYNWRWEDDQGGGLVTHFSVNRDIGPAITDALRDLQASGHLGDLQTFAGAFAPRNTRGSSSVSAHAYGLALDINADTHPRGSDALQPLNLRVSFMRAGFIDGGTWVPPWATRDPMHYTVGF
jgi:RHS repeat-associated protein